MSGRTRHNGEGSIFPYRNGYAAYAWVTTPTGIRKRKYVYGKTREQVHDAWIKLQQRAKEGTVSTRIPTVAAYFGYWLPEVAKRRLKAQAAKTYETLARLYIVPYLGSKRLDKLTVRDVRGFFNTLADLCTCCLHGKDDARPAKERRCCAIGRCCQRRLSGNTLRDIKKVLVVALNDAIVDELIVRNPAALVRLPTVRRRNVKPWSVEEAKAFLVSARDSGDPFYAAYVLILVLGLRRGEVLGLTWPLVDLDSGQVQISHSLQRINGELVLGETKTESSDAPLPLPDICATALQLRREDQDRQKRTLGARWPDAHQLVFTTRAGAPIDPRNFLRSFVNRCDRAGVRRIRVHDTRHTCGSLLAALDVHPRVAMQILRHSRINVTMEIYTHVPSELTRRALKKLGDSFGDLAS
jgi:integrase